MPHITFTEFRDATVMPPAEANAVNAAAPAFFVTLERWQRDTIHNGLRRRYVVPIGIADGGAPTDDPDPSLVPGTIKRWHVAWMTLAFYQRRGYSPASEQDTSITEAADRATAELRAAADPNAEPLPELPLRADSPNVSGVRKGGPVSYGHITHHGYHDALAERRNRGGW